MQICFLLLRKSIVHMQIIDIQEKDYNKHMKKKNNHALNKTITNHSCYGNKHSST